MNNIATFFEKFTCVGKAENFLKKEKILSKQKCRFCGKEEPVVSFSMEAHVLPELLGENNFTSNFECDACNSRFSKYESHLATLFRSSLSLIHIKGKRKVPIFQSREENRDKNSITRLKSTDTTQKEFIIGKPEDYEIDQKEKKVTITFRNSAINPSYVYRALVKIGLSLLPQKDIINHEKSFSWLLNEDADNDIGYIRLLFVTNLKRKKFEYPMAQLYQAKKYSDDTNCEYPNHVLIIGFANKVLQVYLPFSKDYDKIHDETRTLSIDLFPGFIYDGIHNRLECDMTSFDLGVNRKVIFDEKVNFFYEEFGQE